MFDMTFPTPESLNKYRDDNKINQKILQDEEIYKQNKNLSEMFDKNLNKYFNEKKDAQVDDLLNMNSTDLIKVDKNENVLKDVFEIDTDYKFITDEDILSSFGKVFKDYKIIYRPYKKSKNICFTTDILTPTQLLHWKYEKFKTFVKSTLHHIHSLGDLHTWYPFNYNLSDLEIKILSGNLNMGSIS